MGRGVGGEGAQVQHQLQQWAKYWYSIVWDMFTQCIYKGWKLTKIDATIICKPHAHPHIMKITYTKFQKCKRSCAHNKHPLSIYSGWKMTKFTMSKKWQNWSNNYVQSTCTSSYHEENTCKVSKQLVQNCKRSCAHNKYPLSIYSGWKMTKFTMPKKWQKLIQQLCPIHMRILIPWEKHMQSLKTIGTKL